MALTYEISKFESNMPIRCVIHHIGNMPKHSHEMFEILFILSGECTLTMDDHLYQLKADDIIIVENFSSHELASADCVYCSIQLDQTRLENTFPSPIHPSFECNSQVPGKEDAFDSLRRIIAKIIKNSADKPLGYELKNWIYIYELMEILFMNFRVERSEALDKKNHRYAQRVYEISKIIKEHYTEDLTLSALADMMHLSVPYLSKFFMEHFGVNYLTYLTNLRVKNAEYELVHTDKTIETIAADFGFPNGNAFTAAFKKEYGILPSSYRRNARNQPIATAPIEYRDYMSSLKKYLSVTSDSDKNVPISVYHDQVSINLNTVTKPLTNTWKDIVAVGQASDLLLADVQKMLADIQKDFSFSYVFFNGILSDSLYLYNIDLNNVPSYNYTYIDRIFDFLISIKIKPMMPFTYTPRALAKDQSQFLFSHLVSEPKSFELWNDLITNFMNHIIKKYGIEEIKTWRFSVWHQPNTPARLYGFSSSADFYRLYKNTYDIVKSFSRDIVFGLPCMYYLEEESDGGYIIDMINWCKSNNCIPDYFSYTFYDTTLDSSRNKTKDSFGFIDFMTLNPKPDGLKKAITNMKRISRNCDLEKLPIYICEWNNTPSQQDYLNDTCYKSCYITKNILDNYDRLNGLAYWALTDLMTENINTEELFFGGLGLFTTNGIPKASYYALTQINALGNEYLSSGDGWFATKNGKEVRILAYHYKHYTDLYAAGERFDMTATDRYTMFEPSNDLHFSIDILGISSETCQVTEYILNRENGSSFDTWIESGCIGPDNSFETDYIRRTSVPKLHKYVCIPTDGVITLNVTMKILETRLIIIKQ